MRGTRHLWAPLSEVFYWGASDISITEFFLLINQKLQKRLFHSCLESRHLAVIILTAAREEVVGFQHSMYKRSFNNIPVFGTEPLPTLYPEPPRKTLCHVLSRA